MFANCFRNSFLNKIKNVNRIVKMMSAISTAVPKPACLISGSYGLMGSFQREVTKHSPDEEIRKASSNNEKALLELMQVLADCISEISEQYRDLLLKQIEITKKATAVGPIGSQWDLLTEYRVLAQDLKEELIKYENLMKSIANLSYDQVVSSLIVGNEATVNKIDSEYRKLEQKLLAELAENRKCEADLLSANHDSILYGV